MSETIKKLSAEISEAAIQRTDGKTTRKGYNTTGYGYQTIVDRLNDVCGENWGFTYDIINTDKGNYKSGQPFYDITVNIDMWISDKDNKRSCVGGHTSGNFPDALKGAITNGIKKTAALWGVGRAAFAGELDDDNIPFPDNSHNKIETPKGNYEKAIEVLGNVKDIDELDMLKTMAESRVWTDHEKLLLDKAFKHVEKKLLGVEDDT